MLEDVFVAGNFLKITGKPNAAVLSTNLNQRNHICLPIMEFSPVLQSDSPDQITESPSVTIHSVPNCSNLFICIF
jgi:hypothetical protein